MECLEKIDIYTKTILFEIAINEKSSKDIYLRNSIAKADSLLKSIHILYENKSFYDGWILYRALTDRLVHLYYLEDTNSYEDFRKWTYIKKYEYWNNAKSHGDSKEKMKDHPLSPEKEDSLKYKKLKAENIKWARPDAETILKKRNLSFLYKFGYDFASAHTHPLYDDGQYEFFKLTGLEPNPYKRVNNEELIRNSIIIYSLIANECLNISPLKFSKILFDFTFSLRKVLEGDFESYQNDIMKIIILKGNNINLCE